MSEAQTNTELRERVAELETRVQELEQLLQEPQTQESTTSDTIEDVEFIESTVFELVDEEKTITAQAMDFIRDHERAYGEGMEIEAVISALMCEGRSRKGARNAIDKLRREGSIYEPESGRVKVV